ncbi:gp53-like domain-containing protein [Photorhabdus namnaonensis]|uniref:Phage tail fiber repeat protein n=1 Tax=Photorhabdus namnaonensis TaxID=1851568 RepID=A0A1B8YL65_9GAMM|nr:tail fiber protein [Photorhabdus namnaonensis]OCA55914.1 Phage tail fiber repeat protein [Photorhabdus namnaonensis]
MSQKNDFKAFSVSNDANVVHQEKYEENQSLQTGFPPNTISIDLLNKVLRQSSIISSVIADFIATQSGNDILDDGDIVKITAQLDKALEQKITTAAPNASLTQKGVVQLTNVVGNSDALAVTQKLVQNIINSLNENINGKVSNTRKINGKVLSSDISINSSDVGSYDKSESDGKYQPRGNYQPVGLSYTKDESDYRYGSKNTALRAANGWWKCGDTGMIYQWGRTPSSLSESSASYSFPIAFPNACAIGVATPDYYKSEKGSLSAYFNIISNAVFRLTLDQASNDQPAGVFWFAIGW